ncbi:hypothetical protein [Ligilactobacillus salivarius]|uniref:hypothetical protein n=1 Tax=Ligilactobacillus salivarius TaxID=1624 RepID=UPI0020748893|nr:hypothetical protein [Ligilactobacillus salivarius]MDE1506713.1 hypothetical protein [Ligilactobacillus salivarius]MDE1521570.1 hypothetical protein [Ligilactobacillus salivarius]
MARKYRIEFTDDDMGNMKLYIDEEEKLINFLKLTYKKGTKKVVLRYLEPNTYEVKFDVLGNQLGLLDIVPNDFD